MDNTTRRRVIQGAGVIGITGVVGSSAVAAQESPTGTAGGAALRVTHASPDAPPVTVRLDDQTAVESLSFGTVTGYQSVDPGSYQLRIVSAGDGGGGGFLGGLFDDILGSSQDGQTVIYEDEVTVEEGATYTAVAYGEVAQGVAETPTGGTATPTPDGGTATPTVEELQAGGGQPGPLVQDLAFGETATATVPAGDYRLLVRPAEAEGEVTPTPETTPTPEGAMPTAASTPEAGTEFQVEILEDDLSDPPAGESRVRVFHAVPDLGPVNIIATPQGGQGQGAGGQGQGPPLSADVSLEAGTVYSTFAVGYVNPEAAAAGTPTDTTPAGTPTGGSPTGTPAEDLPGFELLVAETATGGERAEDGGT